MCDLTFGVAALTLPARASEPWTFPIFATFARYLVSLERLMMVSDESASGGKGESV